MAGLKMAPGERESCLRRQALNPACPRSVSARVGGPAARTSVLRSVTVNARSLLLTALLCAIVVYLFSLVGFALFPEAFVDDDGERRCDTLWQCFVLVLTQGLRAEGGVGGLLGPSHWGQPRHTARLLYDFLFYVVVIVCLLNIVFGIIIDTFGQLRTERESVQRDTQRNCFICGIDSYTFDRLAEGGFRRHIKEDHCMWNYLYFLQHLRTKPEDDFTGQESYVWNKVRAKDISFFPLNRALVLQDRAGQEEELAMAMAEHHHGQQERISRRVQQIEQTFLSRVDGLEKAMARRLAEVVEALKAAPRGSGGLAPEPGPPLRYPSYLPTL